jgi:hypothetical protein
MLEDNAPTQRLKTVVGDYTTGAGAHTLVTWLNSHAQAGLDHVVSIHGGETPSAKLLDVKGGDFRDTMHTVRHERKNNAPARTRQSQHE